MTDPVPDPNSEPAASNPLDQEDYRNVAARDTGGRVLPGCFPTGSHLFGTAIEVCLAEERTLDTLREWQASENDIDLRARLWAWKDIETSARLYAQGGEVRAECITDVPHSPQDVAAMDAVVALWGRMTDSYREAFLADDARYKRQADVRSQDKPATP